MIVRRLLGAAGVVFLGIGVWQGITAVLAGVAEPVGTAVWWLAGPVLVDAALVPVATVVAYGISRRVAAAWRAPLAAAFGAVVMVSVIALPFVAGWGRKPANPSLLDRDYVAGYLVVVGVIVMVAFGWGVVNHLRRSPDLGRQAVAEQVDEEGADRRGQHRHPEGVVAEGDHLLHATDGGLPGEHVVGQHDHREQRRGEQQQDP